MILFEGGSLSSVPTEMFWVVELSKIESSSEDVPSSELLELFVDPVELCPVKDGFLRDNRQVNDMNVNSVEEILAKHTLKCHDPHCV